MHLHRRDVRDLYYLVRVNSEMPLFIPRSRLADLHPIDIEPGLTEGSCPRPSIPAPQSRPGDKDRCAELRRFGQPQAGDSPEEVRDVVRSPLLNLLGT